MRFAHSDSVQRVAGQDRYGTAVEVARALGNPPMVFLATGRNFPDSMTAGPVAASVHGVVLLTDDDRLPQVTADYLHQNEAFPSWAFGDQAAKAYPRAQPVAGADRYETAMLATGSAKRRRPTSATEAAHSRRPPSSAPRRSSAGRSNTASIRRSLPAAALDQRTRRHPRHRIAAT
jgi:hypothetical protein